MISRRQFAHGFGTVLAGSAIARGSRVRAADWPGDLPRRLAALEAGIGGRFGVAVLDTATGRLTGHREEERFPMCSTFKALAAAAVLARVDKGEVQLAQRVRFTADEVVPYSPATKPEAGGEGMTLAAICEAAITLSDNTAGNLMLGAIGGPAGLTAYLRGTGDQVTRLDRTEPTLNEALPGDPRDTTSPRAMAQTLGRLVVGDALEPASREQLADWLVATRTGDARLRAGVPKGWRVGDKTGTGDRGTANDVGVLWPPGRAPIVIAAYVTGSEASVEARSAAIAAAARAAVEALGA